MADVYIASQQRKCQMQSSQKLGEPQLFFAIRSRNAAAQRAKLLPKFHIWK